MAFITGASGLLGAHLALKIVQNGEELHALKRNSTDLQYIRKTFLAYDGKGQELFDSIHWIEGDLLDFYLLDSIISKEKEIYHTAAMVSFDPKDRRQIMQVNVEGTINIVESCKRYKARLIYCSSIAALGRGKENEETAETDLRLTGEKSSVYSQSKFEAEQAVWRGIAEGLNAAIVNPSVILGPGNWNKSSGQLFRTIDKGLKFYTNGSNSYVDAVDVAQIMYLLMKSTIKGERFIVSAANLSYKDLFTQIALSINAKPPKYLANKVLSALSWRLLKLLSIISGKRPLITKETATNANTFYRYSSEKVKQTLNYNFIPIEESIHKIGALYLHEKTN